MDKTLEILKVTIQGLREWFTKPDCLETYYSSRIIEINRILESENLKSAFRQFDYLNTWFSNKFVYDSEMLRENDNFPLLASNGYFTISIVGKLAAKFPDNPPKILFDRYCYMLANCFIAGWQKEASEMLKVINNGLDSKLLKGGLDFKQTAWYILMLANKFMNESIDYSKYNVPQSIGVYREVLENWDSVDIDMVDEMVSSLCDYHLSQSNPSDAKNLMSIQFSLTYEYIFVYEILVWLKFRQLKGLANPKKYTHPLMNLPVNKLSEGIAQFPKNQLSELFEKVIKKL